MIRRLAAELALAAVVIIVLIAALRADPPALLQKQIFCHYGLRAGGERGMFEDETSQLYRDMAACRASGARSCRASVRDVVMIRGSEQWLAACAGVAPLGDIAEKDRS